MEGPGLDLAGIMAQRHEFSIDFVSYLQGVVCYKVKVDFFEKKTYVLTRNKQIEDMFIHGLNDNIKKKTLIWDQIVVISENCRE